MGAPASSAMPRTGTLANWALGLTALGGLAAIALARVSERDAGASHLPVLDPKPRPVAQAFGDCPPDGDGGDRALNYLKNRTDEANSLQVSFDAIQSLGRPAGVDRVPRSSWTASQRRAVQGTEGLPLAVEGYLVEVREEGAESTNCHEVGPEFRDWHLWLASAPGGPRSASVIVEITPRVRALHPAWNFEDLAQIARDSTRVRVSGWLLLDQEHPEQLGRSRATLWELHPVMRMEVWQDSGWVVR